MKKNKLVFCLLTLITFLNCSKSDDIGLDVSQEEGLISKNLNFELAIQQAKVYDKTFASRQALVDYFKPKITSENSEYFNTIVKTENYYNGIIGGGASYLIVSQENYINYRNSDDDPNRQITSGNPFNASNGGDGINSFIDISIKGLNGKYINAMLINNGVYKSTQIGCIADGETDNSKMINAAIKHASFSYPTSKIILEPSTEPLTIKSSIELSSNQTLIGETWLKVIGNDLGFNDAAVTVKRAYNVSIKDLKIDCNNVPAQSGINVNFDSGNVLIENIIVKNAKHLKKEDCNCIDDAGNLIPGGIYNSFGGGRGIIIESGNSNFVRDSNSDNFVPVSNPSFSNCIINNVIIENCYMGLGLAAGVYANAGPNNKDPKDDALLGITNCIINNVAVSNTEVIVGLFGNVVGEHHSGDRMQYIVNNIVGRNCGKRWNTDSNSFETTFGGNAWNSGLISSDRGSNVTMTNISIVNDSRIGEIFAPIVGDFYNVKLKNYSFEGNCRRLAYFQRYAEQDAIDYTNSDPDNDFDDLFTTKLSEFDINHIGKYSYGLLGISKPHKLQFSKLSICEYNPVEAEKFKNCVPVNDNSLCSNLTPRDFNLHLQGVRDANIVGGNFSTLNSLECEFYNKVLNVKLSGNASHMAPLFINWRNQSYNSNLRF